MHFRCCLDDNSRVTVCCFIRNSDCNQLETVSVASSSPSLRRCCHDEEGPANSRCVMALEWNFRYRLGCVCPGLHVLPFCYRYSTIFGYFHRGLCENLSHRSFASKANQKPPSCSRSQQSAPSNKISLEHVSGILRAFMLLSTLVNLPGCEKYYRL